MKGELWAHGFDGEILFERPKSIQKVVGDLRFRTSLIHPGFLERLRHPGLLSANGA
jgi:hypothetical protein